MITVLCYDFHLHPKAHHIFDYDFILSRFLRVPCRIRVFNFERFYNYCTYNKIDQEPTLSISIEGLSINHTVVVCDLNFQIQLLGT